MKKGIRCNETRYVNGPDRDRIRYEFLSDDDVTPSSCTVCLGDIDPLTGEPITDLTFFREYHRLVDHQVMKNIRAACAGYHTLEQKARREQMKGEYIAAFKAEHGYAPSKADVLYYLEQMEQETWNLSIDSLADRETGESYLDHCAFFCVPFDTDMEESVELQALREVGASLTGRKAEVYEAMLQREAGGQERIRFVDIADKWNVALKQITKDQAKIAAMVRKRAEELRREED